MYKANVVKVFIASPSDVVNEREMVPEITEEWNVINSEQMNLILRVLRWEKNTYPETNRQPQDVINKQILDDSDLLIGIFGTRLGTPTSTNESGTVEEIKRHVMAGKPAMLYFSKCFVRMDDVDYKQYENLKKFEKWCMDNSLYETFISEEDFKDKLRRHLSLCIKKHEYFIDVEDLVGDSDNEKEIDHSIAQERKDLIQVLSNLEHLRQTHDFDSIFKELGQYRFKKINSALEELDILNMRFTGNGNPLVAVKQGFHSYSKEDLTQITNEVRDGKFDYLLM